MQRSTETMEQLGEALRQLEARRQATQVTIQELRAAVARMEASVDALDAENQASFVAMRQTEAQVQEMMGQTPIIQAEIIRLEALIERNEGPSDRDDSLSRRANDRFRD
jgi:chromosome segregation ATPase